MSLTLKNHVHGVLYVVVDATANNSSCEFFFSIYWEVARMGLLGPVAPYLLVVFFLSLII